VVVAVAPPQERRAMNSDKQEHCGIGLAASRLILILFVILVSRTPGWSQTPSFSNPADGDAERQQDALFLARADIPGIAAPQPNAPSPAAGESKVPEKTIPQASSSAPAAQSPGNAEPQQTKRIMGVLPNFGAVSAHTQLPPLSTREKFKLATEDSVDYSAFIWAGVLAGQGMALRAYPEFHNGIAGYGRYYWREFVNQASGAYFTEAIVPAIMHEDPRYYTLGEGGFFHRTGYALSRVFVTRTDSGSVHFNASEIGGNAAEAALSNLYYPAEERGARKTLENMGTGLESAALNNLVKEFWPDIRKHVLRQK